MNYNQQEYMMSNIESSSLNFEQSSSCKIQQEPPAIITRFRKKLEAFDLKHLELAAVLYAVISSILFGVIGFGYRS